MDYMEKRSVKRVLKGLNLEIQWAKREIRRVTSIDKQAALQRYRHLLALRARECHLKLACANGTPYASAERNVRKPLPCLSDELTYWISNEKLETYTENEYSYSLAG